MSEEATEEKKGKKKKEKKPKKEKPPKEKKPKKEKPPKEKKPKTEKPPKEKKAKKGKETPEGAEGEEGAKKKKGPPLLLILIPAFVVLIVAVVAVVFIVLPKLRGGKADAEAVDPNDPEAALAAQVENTERAKKGDKDADADASGEGGAESADAETDADAETVGEGGEDGGETPEPEKNVDIVVSMTTSESIAYFKSLSPSMLGLPGETMDDYDIFASEHLIFVDDVPCKEFRVYSIADRTSTNTVEGLFLMTQRGARKIYRLDEANNAVTELEITPPKPAEPEPVPDAEALPEEEPPDHM